MVILRAMLTIRSKPEISCQSKKNKSRNETIA